MANIVILMGRLTKDPDIMRGEGTSLVARYTLAVDRRFANKYGQIETDFISCVAFGKAAELAEKYMKKGTKMLITGRIQTGSYTNKDGQKIYTTDVIAEDQKFAECKGSGSSNAEPSGADDDFMNIPDSVKDNMPF